MTASRKKTILQHLGIFGVSFALVGLAAGGAHLMANRAWEASHLESPVRN